jgi:arginine exporter protein ArgO
MTDPVWSVNILLSIGFGGAAYIIYYILNLAYDEMKDASIQSKEDQQSH